MWGGRVAGSVAGEPLLQELSVGAESLVRGMPEGPCGGKWSNVQILTSTHPCGLSIHESSSERPLSLDPLHVLLQAWGSSAETPVR